MRGSVPDLKEKAEYAIAYSLKSFNMNPDTYMTNYASIVTLCENSGDTRSAIEWYEKLKQKFLLRPNSDQVASV